MSRIGRLPITIPAGVEVTIDGPDITVKGPKGTLTHKVAAPIAVERTEEGTLAVTRPNDERAARSLHGLTRTLVANMVTGVTKSSW
jgi:large subunit ribosomal protein L6